MSNETHGSTAKRDAIRDAEERFCQAQINENWHSYRHDRSTSDLAELEKQLAELSAKVSQTKKDLEFETRERLAAQEEKEKRVSDLRGWNVAEDRIEELRKRVESIQA